MSSNLQAIMALLVIVALGFGGWFMVSEDDHNYHSVDELKRTRDMYMQNIVVSSYDENGQLNSQMKTAQLDHYPQNNTSVILKPRVMLYQNKNEPPLHIRAAHGRAIDGTNTIKLRGNVTIHQAASGKTHARTLKTNALTFLPKEKLAYTKARVHIIQQGLVVNAIGMKANLKTNHIQLLNKVRSRYEKSIT